MRIRTFGIAGAVPLMVWLVVPPASAGQFTAPAQVQALPSGEFQYSARYIAGPGPFEIASFGCQNQENTDAGFVGDCFCGPQCQIAPGDSVVFTVHGSLIDPTASGSVWNFVSGCTSAGGAGATEIQPAGTTGVPPVTRAFRISSAPNPCRDRTVFTYSLPEPGPAELRIFDLTGRLIATPLRELGTPGAHTVTWERADAAGKRLPNGMYLARFAFKGQARVLRIAVLD